MRDKRNFVRVQCRVKSSLEHDGRIAHGHLENLSVDGALLRLHDALPAQPGDLCRLSIYPSEEKAPLRIRAELVHVAFSLAGLRFFHMDEQTRTSLSVLLGSIGCRPEEVRHSILALRAEEG